MYLCPLIQFRYSLKEHCVFVPASTLFVHEMRQTAFTELAGMDDIREVEFPGGQDKLWAVAEKPHHDTPTFFLPSFTTPYTYHPTTANPISLDYHNLLPISPFTLNMTCNGQGAMFCTETCPILPCLVYLGRSDKMLANVAQPSLQT